MPTKVTPAQGETVSPDELYDVLCGAASQDPAVLQSSAMRLKQMLQLFGAFNILHEIAAQKTVPLPVRQQSIIQFKNAALGHWRSRRFLSDEQRVSIRGRCLLLLDESDDVISECNSVIIAKIARADYPQHWPDLIPQLLAVINGSIEARSTDLSMSSAMPLRRALEAMNAILKEFMSLKLPAGIKSMAELVQQLHLVMMGHYSQVTMSFSSSITPASITQPHVVEDLLVAHLVFKCVVKMAEWSWNRLVNAKFVDVEPWIHQLFQASAVQLQTLSELRISLVSATQMQPLTSIGQRSLDLLTRHVRLFGKLFQRMQKLSPSRFVTLPMSSDLVLYYWSKVVQASSAPPEYTADTPTAVFPVRFLVQAMVLFKDSLPQWAPVRKDGTENVTSLTKEFVENAVKLLVTRFIPLNTGDLQEWEADPENWVNVEEQENEQWVFELRPCAERVVMTLSTNYHQYVIPLLQMTFEQMVGAAGQHPSDLDSVVQKEALYCAIGRCAQKLKGVIPFEQWLERTLVREAQETNPSYPILKRRIAWLVGKWVSVDCCPANNALIWQILLYLLQDRGPGTDEVVRLTAAMALRECLDTIQFDVNVFVPFLPAVVNELERLTAEAETLESKRRVARSLNTVIERAESRIVPLIRNIAGPLPQLWTTAGEDWLFKVSLLETVTKLIESSKEHSVPLSSLVVPLVRDSLSPGSILHLDQDAMILWHMALRNTVTLEGVDGGPGLIELFPIAISLLSENLDLLGKIVDIIESYYLLDPARVLQPFAVDLFRAYVKAIKQAMGVNITSMATSLTILFQIAPSALWGEALHVSGLFALLVKTLVDDKASTPVLTSYIYVMARIAFADKQLFLNLMSGAAPILETKETELWEGVLNQWWTRFDNMSEPRLRKLAAMGITSLVSTGRPEVLDRLSTEICNLWMDVFSEIKEAQVQDEDDPTLVAYWDQPTNSFYKESENTLEYARRKALYDNDPARTIQLTAYVAARVQEAESVCGGSAEFNRLYLEDADPLVLQQIGAELTRR
ncbi:ARM repeat-containing protein [Laetiporus sulphureus 93-53]|uniref:ARM repeat-containing protein n=1 Tax=Laetiporus sulphureus 93-53 TaxID=1314785 RepID=A0A165I9K4_9APHY|nr:ARM repeat-containing protein [Laetiporus sulphureus 93-53]KZT12770.1 ARM repeat-containing protein [Laetiporus sulphureus 93-53]